jgi:hypothetical protein
MQASSPITQVGGTLGSGGVTLFAWQAVMVPAGWPEMDMLTAAAIGGGLWAAAQWAFAWLPVPTRWRA